MVVEFMNEDSGELHADYLDGEWDKDNENILATLGLNSHLSFEDVKGYMLMGVSPKQMLEDNYKPLDVAEVPA